MIRKDIDTLYALSIGRRFWFGQFVLFTLRTLSQVLRYPFVISLRDLIDAIMNSSMSFNGIALLTAKVSMLLIAIFVLTMSAEIYGTVLYARIFTSVWVDLASKISRIPESSRLSAGEYLGRFSDASSIPAITLLPTSLSHVIGFIVIAYTLYVLSPYLSILILAALVPLSVIVMWFFGSKAIVRREEARRLYDVVMNDFKNLMDGLTSFKALGKTDYLISKFSKSVSLYFNKYKLAVKGFIMAQRFVSLIWWFSPIISIIVGLLMVPQGLITIPSLIAFAVSINSILPPLESLIQSIRNWMEAKPSARRVRLLMELPEEESGRLPLPRKIERIEYRGVTFRYGRGGDYILKDINFTIRRGECIAIVGGSGVGKTTLVRMLPRLLDPEEGTILINGIDIRKFKLSKLRERIVYLDSHAYVLNATVRENIALDGKFSDGEIWEVLSKCHVDFISSLDYVISEWGRNLSEGQRQRLALARALLRGPEVLILDEALSGVDSKVEGYVISNLKREIPILIIVSHRLSAITLADRILVLSGGRIVCEGRHDELLNSCQEYRDLIARQIIKA